MLSSRKDNHFMVILIVMKMVLCMPTLLHLSFWPEPPLAQFLCICLAYQLSATSSHSTLPEDGLIPQSTHTIYSGYLHSQTTLIGGYYFS